MKKSLILLAFIILGIAASNKQDSVKFGFVNMQVVILKVKEGKIARAALEKEIKAKDKFFQKEKKELEAMNKNWQKQSALMNEKARLKKQQAFQEKFLKLRKEETNFKASIRRKEQQATQKIAVKVAKVVEKLSKKKNLDAVFEMNSSGLLYLKNPVNMTEEVVKAYEAKSKISKKSK